jgi:hypothetical protein
LSSFEDTDIMTSLKPLAQDPYWQVRQATAFSLGKYNNSQTTQIRSSLLKDPYWQVRQAAVASSGLMEHPLKLTTLTPLLSDKNLLVRQTAEQGLGLSNSSSFGQKTLWTSSSQMYVNNMISDRVRQSTNEVLSGYTEKLLTRDINQTMSYHLGAAGLFASPGSLSFIFSFLSLTSKGLADFGPRSTASLCTTTSNVLTLAGLGRSVATSDWIDAGTAIGGYGFGEASRRVSSTIGLPSSISVARPFSNYDGYTSISGYASVSVTYTPPPDYDRYRSMPEVWEGTRVISSSASWVERTSPSLQPLDTWDTHQNDYTQPLNNWNTRPNSYTQPYRNWNTRPSSYTQPYRNWSTYP